MGEVVLVLYLADHTSSIPSHSAVIILFKTGDWFFSVIFEWASVKSVQKMFLIKVKLLY